MTFLSRSLLAATAVAATCLVPTGCGTGTSTRTTTPLSAVSAVTPRPTGEVPFEAAWELSLPGKVERSWIGEQIPNLVFFQIAGTHEIHCVDITSGQTRWVSERFRLPILGEAFVQRQLQSGEREREVIVNDRLYVIVDDTLFCLDIGTGQRVWHYVLPFAPSSGPLAAGDTEGSLRVFIGDWNNKLQVVGLHQPTSEQQHQFPYVAWQMNVPAPILAQGAEIEDLTYLSDSSGRVHCYKLDRTEVWEVETGAAIDGGVTLRDRTLYAGNDGNAVHAINRLTGERLGQFNLPGPVRRRPFWFTGEPERLYLWIDSPDHATGGLVALTVQPDNIAQGDGRFAREVVRFGQEWRVPGATRLLGSTPLHLLVGDARQDLVWAVHRGTGQVLWTWDVSAGWPKGSKKGPNTVDHIVTYQDRSDQVRGLIAVDDQGNALAFRMYGFIPTPAQETTGVTSRALANQAVNQAAGKPVPPVAPVAEPAK